MRVDKSPIDQTSSLRGIMSCKSSERKRTTGLFHAGSLNRASFDLSSSLLLYTSPGTNRCSMESTRTGCDNGPLPKSTHVCQPGTSWNSMKTGLFSFFASACIWLNFLIHVTIPNSLVGFAVTNSSSKSPLFKPSNVGRVSNAASEVTPAMRKKNFI